MGIFATRTPHRPCPIGLSVAKVSEARRAVADIRSVSSALWTRMSMHQLKPHRVTVCNLAVLSILAHLHPFAGTQIEGVSGGTVILSGVDLVDGTVSLRFIMSSRWHCLLANDDDAPLLSSAHVSVAVMPSQFLT